MTTPVTTTLKALREHNACVEGYNKLVCHLSGEEYDEEKTSHIRFHYDKEINILTILESNGLDDALWALRASNASDRDMRLYAVWCARQVEHLMEDQRSKDALEAAERFANGNATVEELYAARAAAWAAARAAARAAAWAAAWAAQKEMFIKMCNGNAPWQQMEIK